MKKLFLDDVRIPFDCVRYMLPVDLRYIYEDEDWDIVRTYNDFVGYVSHFGVPDLISFDHDLADEHYHPSMFNGDNTIYNDIRSQFKEKTGYDCAKWLCDYCTENGLPLPTYLIHSMNPVGRDNILGVLKNFEKFEKKVK